MKVKVTPAARKKAQGKKGNPEAPKPKDALKKSKPVAIKAKAIAGGKKDKSRKPPRTIAAQLQTTAHGKRMQSLVNFSPDAIVIASPARHVLFWSVGAAVATGRSVKEAKGADFFALLNIVNSDSLAETFAMVAAGGEWAGEFQTVSPDGTHRTLHGRWKFLPGGRTASGSVLLLNRDITELKTAALASLRAQRLDSAGELACTIAHDLNNVLSPIVIGADALEAISGGSDSADIVKLIKESAQRAAKIVRQVLLFVRGYDEEKAPAAQESGADSPPASGELIIVADDEPVIAELCRCVLEGHGYRVEVAVDGVAALALFDQYRSSVRAVISDMAMPFMDGVDLTRAIRRLDPKVPILIATGSADVTARAALEGFPFVSLLSKPYTQRGLLEALQHCLGSAAGN